MLFDRAMMRALLFAVAFTCACATTHKASIAPPPPEARAIVVEQFGAPMVLKQLPVPKPGAGEVLVEVHAAAVNPVDAAMRDGHMQKATKVRAPFTPGQDISGVVAAIGEGVTAFKPGDEVYGYLSLDRAGAFADYVVAPEADLAPKPRGITHEQAAAIPLTALTAWQAMFEVGELSEGQQVLIHGGSGGVGTMAVQLAKARGAKVAATASAENLEYLKSLGADQSIDYKAQKFEDEVKDVDFVLDAIGRDTQARSWGIIRKGGMLVSLVQPPPQDVWQRYGVRGTRILVKPNGQQLREIAGLVESGKLKPVVTTVLPLSEAAKAEEMIRSRHTRGKIVLKVR